MTLFRTHLSMLESSVDKHGSACLLKIPYREPSGQVWKDVTFAEFLQHVQTCARRWAYEFAKRGWEKQSVVGLWLKGTSYRDLVNIWGISRAGYIPQMISVQMPNPTVVYELLNCAGAVAVITDPDFEPLLTDTGLTVLTVLPILFGTEASSSGCESMSLLPDMGEPFHPNDVMMISHTSGSTSGSPKLVPITVRWLDNAILKMSQFKMPTSSHKQQVVVSGGSFCHMASNLLLWGLIHRGGCIILPNIFPYSSLELQRMSSQCGFTILHMFSSFLSKLFADARHNEPLLALLQALDHIVYGGLSLRAEDETWARQQGLHMVNIFASSEVGLMLESDDTLPHPNILKPLPGTSYKFVPLPDAVVSENPLLELVVPPESPDCPQPELRSPETGNFHTGDLFVEVQQGLYVFKGRSDDWIKMEGAMRCNTSQIEDNAVQTCGSDLIDAAVVVGAGRPRPVLVVEPKEGVILASPDSVSSLRREILQRIMEFHSRRYGHERIDSVSLILVAPRASLPRTVTKGNIRRKMVEEQYKGEMDGIFAASF